MSLQAPDKVRTLRRKLYEKAKREPGYRFYLLYDKVHREDILAHAYALARENRGAPGVDGVRFEDIEASGRGEWLARLREELREKRYTPDPVRRVLIPKPGGGERPLGIPTIRDRVVQTAAVLVLGPIFEADFEDSAYGYRPGRSAKEAVEAVEGALRAGYTDVVDADLSKYFDTIPHDALMRSVARRVVDRQMLRLVKAWLKVPVEERDGAGRKRMTGGKNSRRGTPQGGVISPLLANVYMNRYLRAWRQQGKGAQYRARIVNYADDFVILSRGKAAEALAWTRRAMGLMGLTLNEKKTCLRNAREEHFDFLGYTFGPGRWPRNGPWQLEARPSKKAVQRLKERLRGVFQGGAVAPWEEVVAGLNPKLRGWAGYFDHGPREKEYRGINHFVYELARGFLVRRHKVPGRGEWRFSRRRVFGKLGVLRLRVPRPRPHA